MRRFRWLLVVLVVLCVIWLGAGTVVWSRNRVPNLDLPPSEMVPAGNVYEQYLKCVSDVQEKDSFRAYNAGTPLTAAQKRVLLARNADVLKRFHALPGRPCVVTQREEGANFTAPRDYPYLGAVIGLDAAEQAKRDPGRALDGLLDGLTFCEDVLRGGAVWQLLGGGNSVRPVCMGLGVMLPRLSAAQCRQGADRVKGLLDTQYPLPKIMDHERYVRITSIGRAFHPIATQIFRLQVPTDGFGWSELLQPRTAALSALNDYFLQWTKAVDRPIWQMQPPQMPAAVAAGFPAGNLAPDVYAGLAALYRYKEARLRLVYAGLRVQGYRKTHGRYPASLADLGSDPYFVDPFSGRQLVYAPSSNSFALYSIGPNGSDDRGATERLSRDGVVAGHGDIAMAPPPPG